MPGLPDVPFTLDTLTTIAPYAFAMALVGLMESLMTAKLVDDITDTHSSKTRESIGQGIANIVTGFFGGMGGCAMIGQTMINVKVSGARTRLSTFLAGVFLMVLCIVFGAVVSDIPMAALVAVMVMVSVRDLRLALHRPEDAASACPPGRSPSWSITVAVVVATDNLAIGVVVGSITAMVIFAKRVAHLADVTAVTDPDGTHGRLPVTGELFFASVQRPRRPVRLRRRPRQGRHRPVRRPHLGRLLRRRPRRHRDQVRPARQDRRDHRPERPQRRPPPSSPDPCPPTRPADPSSPLPAELGPDLPWGDR